MPTRFLRLLEAGDIDGRESSSTAIYAEAVNRTFFLYGSTDGTNNTLRNFISCFDHTTELLARPHEVRYVGGNDNNKNATLAIDDDGYLPVFGNSHGNSRSGNYYKRQSPYSIADFNEITLPSAVFNNNAGAWLEGKAGDASRTFNGGLELSKDGGEVFVSFLMRKNLNGGTCGDNVEVALANGTTQVVRVGNTSDDKFFLGFLVGSGQAVVGDPLTIGETYFVVLKGESSASGNNQFFATFYDHTEAVPESEPTDWDLSWATSSSLVLDTLRLALGANAMGSFDEFRLGSSWAEVAVPSLAGDFNADRRVDAADYVVWRKGFGTEYDESDYDVWRANFGTTADADGASVDGIAPAVPEPITMSILIAGLYLCSIVVARDRRSLP